MKRSIHSTGLHGTPDGGRGGGADGAIPASLPAGTSTSTGKRASAHGHHDDDARQQFFERGCFSRSLSPPIDLPAQHQQRPMTMMMGIDPTMYQRRSSALANAGARTSTASPSSFPTAAASSDAFSAFGAFSPSNTFDNLNASDGCLAGPANLMARLFSAGNRMHDNNRRNDPTSAPAPAPAPKTTPAPTTHPSVGHTEETPECIIAKEMKELSLGERENAYEEIHGVAREQAEDAQFIRDCCDKLDKEIKRITNISARHAYDRCAFLNPKYVKSTSFRLLFLRADHYDAQRAANRIMHHFTKKLELFGYDMLAKDVTWDDLSDDDRASVEGGGGQFFPTAKDRTGRAIFFLAYAVQAADPAAVYHSRAVWYSIMSCLLLDDETQRKGMTAVLYSHNATVQGFLLSFTIQQHTAWVNTCLPFRLTAMHFCMEDETLRKMFSLVAVLMPKEIRTRVRLHYGTNLEVQYALNTFGILNESLTIDGNGRVDPNHLQQRIRELRHLEAKKEAREQRQYEKDMYHITDKGDRVVKVRRVTSADVLLGRGRPYHHHPGNHTMMRLVDEQKSKHDVSSRSAKKQITEEIVKQIKRNGGRFLKRVERKKDSATKKPSKKGDEQQQQAATELPEHDDPLQILIQQQQEQEQLIHNHETDDDDPFHDTHDDLLASMTNFNMELLNDDGIDNNHDNDDDDDDDDIFYPYWIEVTSTKAQHEKIAMTFRNKNRKEKEARSS